MIHFFPRNISVIQWDFMMMSCHVMVIYIYIVNSSATKIRRFIVIQSQLVYTCIYIHSHMISSENWVRLEHGLNTPKNAV